MSVCSRRLAPGQPTAREIRQAGEQAIAGAISRARRQASIKDILLAFLDDDAAKPGPAGPQLH